MTDRDDILELTFRYAQAMDRRDAELLLRCLEPSVRAIGSGPGAMGAGLASGTLGDGAPIPAAEFAAQTVGALAAMGPTQHLFSNHLVTWRDDDHATVTFSMRAMHFPKDQPLARPYEVGGSYEDDVVRASDGWRIEWWRLRLDWELGDIGSLYAGGDAPS